MNMVNHIAEKIGIDIGDEEVITFRNRGGHPYAYAKGFTLSHCTFSYETGPTEDYSEEFLSWLKGLGFRRGGSYGDNGMDSSTNWRDTYWHNEVYYEPSKVNDEDFYEWVEK